MANWRDWAAARGKLGSGRLDSYYDSSGYKVSLVASPETMRYKAKEESIRLSAQNLIESQRVARERAKKRAEAAGTQASMTAAQAATFSSRLLTEFESRRSQKRALAQRKEDIALGQVAAGFGAAGVESLGAQAETLRQSNLERIVMESQLNTEKMGIIQRGQAGITGALSSLIGAQASLSASNTQARTQTAKINPFKPTVAYEKYGSIPFIEKGW